MAPIFTPPDISNPLLASLTPKANQTLLDVWARWLEARKGAPTATLRMACDGAFARLACRCLNTLGPEDKWDALESLIPSEVDAIERGLLLGYAKLLGSTDTWVQSIIAHCRPDASLAELAQAIILAEAAESRGRLDSVLLACLGELISAILTVRGFELIENVEFQLADVWVVLRSSLPQVAGAATWVLGVRCKRSAA